MIKKTAKKILSGQSVTAVFFGDSVTHGYFESYENMHGTTDYNLVYHKQLKNKINHYFPNTKFNVINAGVGGDTAAIALNRIEKDVLSHSPDLVCVCFGLNDINGNIDEYVTALKDIFAKLQTVDADIIFMTPNMLNTAVTSDVLKGYAKTTADYQNNGKMDDFINAAIQLCNKCSVMVCDCYSKWKQLHKLGVDTNTLLANRINHPSRQMHGLFADELFNTIFWSE